MVTTVRYYTCMAPHVYYPGVWKYIFEGGALAEPTSRVPWPRSYICQIIDVTQSETGVYNLTQDTRQEPVRKGKTLSFFLSFFHGVNPSR